MNRTSLALIVAALLFSACGDLVEIRGVVIDAATRRPIPGATVTLSVYDRITPPDTTADDGSYFLSTVATGVACGVPPVRVVASYPGYESRREIYAGSQTSAIIALKRKE
jgi:hypothetical protein